MIDPTLDWGYVEQLSTRFRVPVVVKGVLTAEDAVLAAEHGAAGIVVSNHGGRQLDLAPSTLDVLPEIVEAVGERLCVLVDGGIRRGSDVLVALALGARAVLVGRTALWGLAAAGEQGAAEVLQLLREEIEIGLHLLGCRSSCGRDSSARDAGVEAQTGAGYHRLPVSGDDIISTLARNAVHLLPEGGLEAKLDARASTAGEARDRCRRRPTSTSVAPFRSSECAPSRMQGTSASSSSATTRPGSATRRDVRPSAPSSTIEEIDRNAQTYCRAGHARARP